jgi:hypothetical protein
MFGKDWNNKEIVAEQMLWHGLLTSGDHARTGVGDHATTGPPLREYRVNARCRRCARS